MNRVLVPSSLLMVCAPLLTLAVGTACTGSGDEPLATADSGQPSSQSDASADAASPFDAVGLDASLDAPSVDGGGRVDASGEASRDASSDGALRGAAIRANSCNQPDVQAAVDSAAAGDTVLVPSGTCTWTSNVLLGSKPITLQGAGIGATNIVNGVTGIDQNSAIQFSEDATLPTRITGFSFSHLGYSFRAIKCTGAYTSASMRIDHNSFASDGTAKNPGDTGTGSVEVDVWSCRGLVDHNTFSAPDNAELVHHHGPGDPPGYGTDVVPGSTNALYLEDNTFSSTNPGCQCESAFQAYNAAVSVVRYNTVNDAIIDEHGTAGQIGVRWFELYGNTFVHSAPLFEFFDIRAGTGVIFDNHSQSSAIINVRNDSSYIVGWGIHHAQWSPLYIWGNDPGMTAKDNSPSVIAEGVNYVVSSSEPASMLRQEEAGDTPGTTYSYAPFTYPYPLDVDGLPNPN